MIIVVTGARDHKSPETVFRALDRLHQKTPITLLFSGACTNKSGEMCGADWFAIQWAAKNQIEFRGMPARWKLDGYPQAGPIRNERMIRAGKAVNCLTLVHFAGGRGTSNCKATAERYWYELVDGEELGK